jgi:hypothetical protein
LEGGKDRARSFNLPALDQPATLVGDRWVRFDENVAVIADADEQSRISLAALTSFEPVMCLLTDAGTERGAGLAPIT